jgi:farnesyl diphosphate synthase
VLKHYLPPLEDSNSLNEAMRYSVLAPAKRVRPLLVYATGEALKVPLDLLDIIAAAIEYIHCYSLIHDDLPAMDNDDLRRGQPTCHIAFNEAIAILAGDALQTLAFDVLATYPLNYHNDTVRLRLIKLLTTACGHAGMAKGQAIDILSTNQSLSLNETTAMHELKTGKLLHASIMMPAIAAGIQDSSQLDSLHQFAHDIGLAFQIKDDILDIEASTQTLGKKQFADIEQNKSTYPRALGLEASKNKLMQLYRNAMNLLSPFSEDFDPLRKMAHYIIEREY